MLTGIITNDVVFVIVLTLGLTALIMELFIPSFGIIGITGIYLIFESFLAIKNIDNIFLCLIISILLSLSISLIIIKIFFKNFDKNRLVLRDNMSKTKSKSVDPISLDLINKEGIVEKTLRPSGLVKIEGKLYNAVSFGDFISKDSDVKVERIEKNQIYVKEIK
ncbi:NfeD family protein [Helcococcus bovis]|uniref:NfeD family protein n=1 Tax=Helcococcus bovis TaxID=3153252 RepID=UPI0038BAA97E